MSVLLLTTAGLLVANRVVRIGVVIAVLASVVVFAVPNPLGGNLVRLTQFVVVPVALLGVGTVRRRVRPAAVALLLAATAWSASFGVVAALDGTGDPSTHRDYHQPLIDEVVALNADGRPLGRVEIPFTENHWESYFVAPELPFARGWERQTDLERNKVLYDTDLDDATYHQWLLDNAVRWIALPDVALDEGGRPEGELLERAATLDWLEPVWHDAHWQLFEVRDYAPIVDAPATLVSQDVDQIVIDDTASGRRDDPLRVFRRPVDHRRGVPRRPGRRLDDGPPPERRRVPACRRRPGRCSPAATTARPQPEPESSDASNASGSAR